MKNKTKRNDDTNSEVSEQQTSIAHNPFDKDAPRTKKFTFMANDYDIFEYDRQASAFQMTKSDFFRSRCNLPEAKMGAPLGNQNKSGKRVKSEK